MEVMLQIIATPPSTRATVSKPRVKFLTIQSGIFTSRIRRNLNYPPPAPAKTCRFYQLQPYLDSRLDGGRHHDGDSNRLENDGRHFAPGNNFHKETKLLIAVGAPDKLEIIDDVLKALQSAPQNSPTAFQERLQQIINNASPASAPGAQRLPPLTPPTPLMPPPSAKPGRISPAPGK